MKSAAKAVKDRDGFASIIGAIREPLLVLDKHLRVISASRSFYNTFKVKEKETVGELIYKLGNGQWNIPALKKLLTDILPKKKNFADYEVEHEFKTIGKKYMILNARGLRREGGQDSLILLAIEDITERKKLELELNAAGKIRKANEKLSVANQTLRETAAYLDNLMEYASAPIIVWNPQYIITRFNRAFEKLTGRTSKTMIGKTMNMLFPGALAKRSMEIIRESSTGNRMEAVEIEIAHIDGKSSVVLWNSSTLFEKDGSTPVATIAQGQDITKRIKALLALETSNRQLAEVNKKLLASDRIKAANKELQALNKQLFETKGLMNQAMVELERSNKELEQFAYIASHDLQEPLRMVASYVQLLEKRYKDKLDKDANDFIFYAVDGAKRMQLLINDLLTYSRLSTKAMPFELVPGEVILKKALKDLEIVIQSSKAQITNGILPDVLVDSIQFEQLLLNLIGNALKFNEPGKTPRVHVSCLRQGDDWVFTVKDEGIGIEKQYFEKVFQIFNRLHLRKEYAGNGIGLAVCKKIVERHKGRIWIESEPGKGTAFNFTLPVFKKAE